ncbi:MAG: hypothetical protein JNL80_05485 [Phycisphaerae bacterium]|nr:hypothetical protein [Phycisphaerae bacterium]
MRTADSVIELTTADLASRRAVVMLGRAGSGKTTEMRNLAQTERAERGIQTFVELACDGPGFRASLAAELSRKSGALYLDALDELLLREPQHQRLIVGCLRQATLSPDLRVRISCRATVWPASVESQLADVISKASGSHGGGEESQLTVAVLQPLSLRDIHDSASLSLGDRASAFVDGLGRKDLLRWAEDPKGLHDLLDFFTAKGALPDRLADLLEEVSTLRLSDPIERREAGWPNPQLPHRLREAAEWLAVLTLLTGRSDVDLSDERSDTAIGEIELASLAGTGVCLDGELLRAVRATSLFDAAGTSRFRFCHRLWSEYLAARRISGLPLRTIRSLVCDPTDSLRRVAGPLRELSSFIAMMSPDFARWLGRVDPEVFGASDVAGDELRRAAFQRFLDEILDSGDASHLLHLGTGDFKGFLHPEIGNDLRRALSQRRNPDQACALLRIVRELHLEELADECASLALDATAELIVRSMAARVVRDIGDDESRRRLAPLCAGSIDDCSDELKGIALAANWPRSHEGAELLEHLGRPKRTSLIGSYRLFLSRLDSEGYDGPANLLRALSWAESLLGSSAGASDFRRRSDLHDLENIVRRISLRGLRHCDESAVADRLAHLLLLSRDSHWDPPLPLPSRSLREGADKWWQSVRDALGHRDIRRTLITSIARLFEDPADAYFALDPLPDALAPEDFEWMLIAASDVNLSESTRRNYAQLAWGVREWWTSLEATQAWLDRMHVPLVATMFGAMVVTELDSRNAKEQRENWRWQNKPAAPTKEKLDPIAELRRLLSLPKDDRGKPWPLVVQWLSHKPDGSPDSIRLNLCESPLWPYLCDADHELIAECARNYLELRAAEGSLPGPDMIGVVESLLLMGSLNPASLRRVPRDWWQRFGHQLLLDFSAHVPGELPEARARLINLVVEHGLDALIESTRAQMRATAEDVTSRLRALLLQFLPAPPQRLVEIVLEELGVGRVALIQLDAVIEFLLAVDRERAIHGLRSLLEMGRQSHLADVVVAATAQLLVAGDAAEIPTLNADRDLAKAVLLSVSATDLHADSFRGARNGDDPSAVRFLASLARLLMREFSFLEDPVHDGAYTPTADDEARRLRDRLLDFLALDAGAPGLASLASLVDIPPEAASRVAAAFAFGSRQHRLGSWTPHQARHVVEVVTASSKLLIRSPGDLLDAVEDSIAAFQDDLDADGGELKRDYWETDANGKPRPELEDRTSNRLRAILRRSFARELIVANREVEVSERRVAEAVGGAAGSKPDFLLTVPGMGAVGAQEIRVPIEAKRSFNREARMSLVSQLAERYLPDVSTRAGVFLLYWYEAPGLDPACRPVWASKDEARSELLGQAARLRLSQGVDVRVCILDLSLF